MQLNPKGDINSLNHKAAHMDSGMQSDEDLEEKTTEDGANAPQNEASDDKHNNSINYREFFDALSSSEDDLSHQGAQRLQEDANRRQEDVAARVTPASSSSSAISISSLGALAATAVGALTCGLPGAVFGLGSSMVASRVAEKAGESSKGALFKLNEPIMQANAAFVSLGNALNPNDQRVFVAITSAFQLIGELDEEYENNKEETLLSLKHYLSNLSKELIPYLRTRNLLDFQGPLTPELRERLGLQEGEELSAIIAEAIRDLDATVKALKNEKNDLTRLNQDELKDRMNEVVGQHLHRIANLTANHYTIPESINRTTNHLNEQIPVISQNIANATGAHKEFCHTTKSWVSGLQENAYFAVIVGITCLTPSIIQIARFVRRFDSNTGPGYAAFFSMLCLTLFLLVTTVAFTSNTRNTEKKRRAERETIDDIVRFKELTPEETKSSQANAAKREFLICSTLICSILTGMLGIEVNSNIEIHVSVYAILFCSSIVFCMTIPLLHGLCGRKLFKDNIDQEPVYHQAGRIVESGYLVALGSVEKVLTTEDRSVN